jgi:hypothetical protein
VKSVSERACGKTWTGEVRTQGGRLPDLAAWSRAFREEVGNAFTIRGVEAVVVGRLVNADGQPVVEVSGTGEVLRLTPLTRKVQWDPEQKREQLASREEQKACRRLLTEWDRSERRPASIRITGPLVEAKDGGRLTLEVREFTWVR